MTDAQIVWTKAEREAAVEAELVELCQNEYPDRDIASKILAALAPFVAEREAAAFTRGAEAMREDCAAWHDKVAAQPVGNDEDDNPAARARHRFAAWRLRRLPIPEDTTP
jgi:hypothetical protein